ncbi:mating type protein mat1-2-1 [Colletotrichum truncatum]|uniref:Mat1-2-1 n=1 Tax=Colletotrichum truncatum TaxID=5467 RepID=A0ACC3Z1F3_COLTU|nr:mating type protein mat1-2-1 [Colletotrichum truncatum]KAF6788922.1 mat1-2-1 [Colletotrichum truncatum]
MALNDFNPGQIIAGYVDPARLSPKILQTVTETLELNMNSFQSVIAVSGKNYFSFGQDGQAFMALYMGRTLNKPVMWVKDGMCSKNDRWILGPCERFISSPHMIVSVNGIAVVVRRPSHQFLEESTGSESGTNYTDSPEPQCKVKVPRPPNAYILYRKDHHAKVKQFNTQLTNNQISVILGKAWNNESHAVREKYTELARLHKERLMMLHPDYRYTPRKPSEKRRRSRTDKPKKLSQAHELSQSISSQHLR